MRQYLFIATLLFSPMAFAQGMLLGPNLLEAAEEPAKKETAPAKVEVVTQQPAQEVPAEKPVEPVKPVDEWAEVRCSANKFTNLAFNKTGKSAGDLARSILKVSDPFNRPISESKGAADPYSHKWMGESFQLNNVGGRLVFHKGTLLGPVDLPAKVCLMDDNKTLFAVLDATTVNNGVYKEFQINLTSLGVDAIQISGVGEDGKALQGSFTTR